MRCEGERDSGQVAGYPEGTDRKGSEVVTEQLLDGECRGKSAQADTRRNQRGHHVESDERGGHLALSGGSQPADSIRRLLQDGYHLGEGLLRLRGTHPGCPPQPAGHLRSGDHGALDHQLLPGRNPEQPLFAFKEVHRHFRGIRVRQENSDRLWTPALVRPVGDHEEWTDEEP